MEIPPRKVGVERPPEPTIKEMTLAELDAHRKRQRGEITSSESDRLTRLAMGISDTLEAPRAPEQSPMKDIARTVRTDLEDTVKTPPKKSRSEK
jgi:hypothetical protein